MYITVVIFLTLNALFYAFEQAHLIVQWKEEFRRRSRVKCPCSGCWLEFPSIYGVKYHYQRCQGVSRQTTFFSPLSLIVY